MNEWDELCRLLKDGMGKTVEWDWGYRGPAFEKVFNELIKEEIGSVSISKKGRKRILNKVK